MDQEWFWLERAIKARKSHYKVHANYALKQSILKFSLKRSTKLKWNTASSVIIFSSFRNLEQDHQ